MKNIGYLLSLMVVLMCACSPMDDKYKDLLGEGPVTYLAKLNDADIKAIGERNRVHFMWPKQNDPRGVKADIYWSNKMGHHVEPVDPSVDTDFYIDGLDEVSYIFEITIVDDEGNRSITVSVPAIVYGTAWESYLGNRPITGNEQDGDRRKISYAKNRDETILFTDFEWKQDGLDTPFTARIDSSQTTGYLENFKASSFRYRTSYIPEEGGVDIFQSPWQYYVTNVTETEIDAGFDKPTNSFTLPIPNDGYWTGYEFRWVDRTTGEEKSQTTTSNTITLEGYNAFVVNCLRTYRFDDVLITSTVQEYETARFFDYDRSAWQAAPETKQADGSPLADVRDAPLADKNKSTYLSHLLPYSGTTPDGWNSPKAHFDGDDATFLSMVKGYGTSIDSPEGVDPHSNGGVTSDGQEVYWIVDLGAELEFDYFRITYRPGQGNANLKPQKLSMYGSNDPDCITDQSKWVIIQEGIEPPGRTGGSNVDGGRNTGNVAIPSGKYRYVKVRYDAWIKDGNTMQISEFYLGYIQ